MTLLRELPFGDVSDELSGFWALTVADNASLTPFHSLPWLHCWTTAYEAWSDAFILESRRRGGQLDALLPLMRWQGTVRSLSYNASDYTGLVWSRGSSTVPAMAAHLARTAATTPVILWNVRHQDALVAALTARDSLRLVDRTRVMAIQLPHARLRPWEQDSPVSLNELRRKRSRLEHQGATIRFSSTLDDATLEQAFDIHTRMWLQRGLPGSFGDSRRREFVRLLMSRGPRLLCSGLWLDGRLLTYRFGLIDERAYYDWNTGSDPEQRRNTPGLVLFHALVARLSMSERVATVDLLRGEEDYKRGWATRAAWISTYECVASEDQPGADTVLV